MKSDYANTTMPCAVKGYTYTHIGLCIKQPVLAKDKGINQID